MKSSLWFDTPGGQAEVVQQKLKEKNNDKHYIQSIKA